MRVATDHEEYFEQICEVMEGEGFHPDPSADWGEGPISAFDRKYREQGRIIRRVVYR